MDDQQRARELLPCTVATVEDFGQREWIDAEVMKMLLEAASRDAAALRAAPEWQPLATAPKDGTAIVGFWMPSPGTICTITGANFGITAFHTDSGEWFDASENDNEDDVLCAPDLWMPLHAPSAARLQGVKDV